MFTKSVRATSTQPARPRYPKSVGGGVLFFYIEDLDFRTGSSILLLLFYAVEALCYYPATFLR